MAGKFKIVISDLHLSAGHQAEGNPLEDFDGDEDFAAFVEEIVAESDRDESEVELIINGDAFEMLQVPHVDHFDPTMVYASEQYHSSSEEDSAKKMDIIIEGHAPFFEALKLFIQMGPPRRSVTFVKGNHDLNLHWPAVQDRIRRAVEATGGWQSLVDFEERKISREGIYVEHGNQYAEALDRIEDMDEPHDHEKPGQLAIPLGSWFVMNVFNKVERDRYWIDGIKPITAMVFYALAYEPVFALRSLATLIRALPGVIRDGLLEATPSPAEDLVNQMEDPERAEELLQRYETDEAFRAELNAEIASLIAPPPDPTTAEAFALPDTPDPVDMAEQIRGRVRSSLFRIASTRAAEEGVKLVTFGHTHDASSEPLPDGGVYINSGTWTWRADFSGAGKETWRDLFDHPERFTDDRRLSYVRIDYEGEEPSGQLLSFQPA